MQHLDEGTIHAWIDGELSPEQASEIEAHMRDCASCAAVVAEARGLVAASTRILTALDHVPGGVLPSVPDIAPAPVPRRRWYQRTDVKAAAALLFVAGASLVVVQSRTDLRGTKAMIATADKAPAASSSSIAEETTGGKAAGRVQQGMADAANVSPLAAAPAVGKRAASSEALSGKTSATTVSPKVVPDYRLRGVGGTEAARNQSLQQKVMADDRASAAALRDESQLSKEAEATRRAADAANLPPPPMARVNAAAPAIAPAPITTQLEGAVVTSANAGPGAATTGAANKLLETVPLRVVRADTTTSVKRIVYEVPQGVEVTLTESPAQTTGERDYAASEPARQKAAAPQRSEAARETPQAASGRVAGAARAMATPPAAPILPLNTISWTDRGKRYTLTGRLTLKDLEVLKARLMQTRR